MTTYVDMPPPPENRIYVANVGAPISETALKEIFESFGTVEQCVLLVRVIYDSGTLNNAMVLYLTVITVLIAGPSYASAPGIWVSIRSYQWTFLLSTKHF